MLFSMRLIAVSFLLLLGCPSPSDEPATPGGDATGREVAPPSDPSAPVPAADAPDAGAAQTLAPREISAEGRQRMLDLLAGQVGDGRRVWIATTLGFEEPAALRDQFRAILEEAGIGVEVVELRQLRVKPGVRVLLASETPPDWAQTTIDALAASGLEVPAARGYRSYFEERKADNPNWPGIPIEDDAEVLLVIGPAPE